MIRSGGFDLVSLRLVVLIAVFVCDLREVVGQVGVVKYNSLVSVSRSEISGTVYLRAPRYFVVHDFRFFECAPAVWWASTKDRSALQLSESIVDESLHLTPQLTVEVSGDVDWNDVVAITLRSVQGGEELAVAYLAGNGEDYGYDEDVMHSGGQRVLLQSGCHSSCTISIGGVSLIYCYCQLLTSNPTFRVLWNQTAPGQEATLAIAFEGDPGYTGGYAGLGFTSRTNRMVGASAMVIKDGGQSPSIEQYYLGGYNPSSVTPSSSNLLVSHTQAGKSGTKLQGAFVLTGNQRVKLTASNSNLNIIWALGSLSSSGDLLQHDSEGSDNIRLVEAATPVAAAPAPAPSPTQAAALAESPVAAKAPSPAE